MKKLVIYHANCADGFTAAWVAWLRNGDCAEYLPAQHGDDPPDVTGRDVLIVDFSYPRATLLEMKAKAASLLVIDHHKTAQTELEGLDFCIFDMTTCGAILTWFRLQLLPNRVPLLISYVNDRDLWKWELPQSREINAYIATIPKEFERWSLLEREIADGFQGTVSLGKVALSVVEQYVETQKSRAGRATIGGHEIPCINTTFAVSELVGALAEGQPFAAG
jgi:hypothetical protein